MLYRIQSYLVKAVAISSFLLLTTNSFASITGKYSLNENSGSVVRDQSGKAPNLMLRGGTHWVAGRSASALEFNGRNQDASTSYANGLQTPSVTISAWIYPDKSQKDWEWVASQADSFGLFIYPKTRAAAFYIKNKSGNWTAVIASTNSIRFGQWQHISGSFDARTHTMKIMVNGKLAASRRISHGILYDTGSGFSIGSMNHQRFFDGRIDEVRVDNTVLSLRQIAQLARVKAPAPAPVSSSISHTIQPISNITTVAGLTGKWSLNENSGTRVNDQTNNHINLTVNHGARWSAGHASTSALGFNGYNQDASTSQAVLLQNPSVTLSAMIYPDSSHNSWQWVAAQADNFGLFIRPNQKQVVFYIKSKSGNWVSVESPGNSFQFNQWQQVAGSYNSITRTLKLYVNGREVASEHTGQGISYAAGNGFTIGSMQHQRFYNGLIDDVQVFGSALSQPEIKQLAGNLVNKVPTPSVDFSSISHNSVGVRFPASRTVRILPLGDSITDSLNERPSYRRPLWYKLKQAGYNVDFVGNSTNTDFADDYDIDHEGHSGWEAGDIEYNMAEWLDYINPDIVMLHIGTNDLSHGQSNESTLDEIDGIIRALREKNSSVIILLAKLIPMRHYDTEGFNDEIDYFVESRTSDNSPIVVVDQYSGFDAYDDLYDSFHPNGSGEEKMANRWFDALQPFLQRN